MECGLISGELDLTLADSPVCLLSWGSRHRDAGIFIQVCAPGKEEVILLNELQGGMHADQSPRGLPHPSKTSGSGPA